MKRKISFLLVLAILCTTLFGCTASSNKSSSPTTITVWHYYNSKTKTQFDELVDEFNETVGKDKGIIVDAYSQGGVNELADALFAAANKDVGAAKMPDMFAAYSDSIYRLDKLDVVASLDEYFTTEELAEYRTEFIEDGRFADDKKLRIFPIAKSTELLFMNKTEFDKFSLATGVTVDSLETWEGIAAAAEKYYEWSEGKAFFGLDSLANFMIVGSKQLGDDIFNVADGKMTFGLSESNAKRLWDCYYTPTIKGHFTSVRRFRSDDVRSGSIIMFIGSNSSASFFPKTIEINKDETADIDSLVMPLPHFEGKEAFAVQQGAGMAVAKSDQKTEAACVEFLKWFTKPEQNTEFALTTSYLPVKNASLSLDKTLEAMQNPAEADIRVQTNKALYEMLETHTLYASKPFDNSVEARAFIDTSLSNYAKNDLEAINKRAAAGENHSKLIEEYSSEGNFKKWYNELSSSINTSAFK